MGDELNEGNIDKDGIYDGGRRFARDGGDIGGGEFNVDGSIDS